MKVSELASALGVSALALAFVLVTGELVLRVHTARSISYDVEMTRYANELKVPAANPRIGHRHRPNARALLMGVPVETNALGMRDEEIAPERGARRRVVFLGDSLTFGWGVEKDDLFETRLEQSLRAEILNFGHGNTNTDQQVALFRDEGLALAPDAVVLFVFINDAEPTPRRSRWAFLGRSRMATFVWSRVKTVRSRLFPELGFEDYYRGLYEEGRPGWEQMKRALAELAELCRAHGIALRAVLLPELHDPAREPFAAQHAKIAAELARHRVPVLDLAPLFRDVEEPVKLWVALDDAHPNARAHRRIAELVRPFLAVPEVEGAR